MTTAEVTNRKGAFQALQRCKPALSRVHALLCDSGYVGKPFAQGVQDILGGHVSVQIAKRSELHRFKAMPSVGWWSAALSGSRRTGGCGRTARGCLTPACSSSIWHFWLCCSKDFEQVLRVLGFSGGQHHLHRHQHKQPPRKPGRFISVSSGTDGTRLTVLKKLC